MTGDTAARPFLRSQHGLSHSVTDVQHIAPKRLLMLLNVFKIWRVDSSAKLK
jgi:hypothetical protein